MELEFDKEIDAILRKNAARTVDTSTSAHLEADEITAFAENALPATTRSFYTKHLADCDRCRTVLAQTISLYPEAEAETASSVVATGTVRENQIPWYRKLLAIPNMAASMGALVLVFAGLLGYLVYQKNFSVQNSDVAKLNETQPLANKSTVSEPAFSGSANAASNSSNTEANTASPSITSGGSPMTKTLGQEDPNQPVIGDDKRDVTQEKDQLRTEVPASQPDMAPTPVTNAPAAKEEQKKTQVDDLKAAGKRRENEDLAKAAASTDTVVDGSIKQPKDESPVNNAQAQNNVGGVFKSKSGPYRNQQEQRSAVPSSRARDDEDKDSANRKVAGRTFEKKDGVWYDSSYRGQTTINIRRGTGEYKILDSGLQNIANSMSGTVVVVWKEKAYRIQ